MKEANDEALQVRVEGKEASADQATLKKFMALIRKTEVEEPRREDVRALRRMLENTPGLWRGMDRLADVAVHSILRSGFAPSSHVVIGLEIEEMRKGYGYEDAPGLERMLIDQILVSWLQLQKTQIQYESVMQNGPSLPAAGSWERRLNGSHGRYLRACETLARVRKLARPGAVQVNIAKQQVNVAQMTKGREADSANQANSVNQVDSGKQVNLAEREKLPPGDGI